MAPLNVRASTWLLIVGLAALAVFFVVTRWWTLFLGVPNGPFAGVHAGMFLVGWGEPNGWHNGVSPWIHRVWNWLPRGAAPGGKITFYVFVPIWMIGIPLGVLTVRKWRRDCRVPATACRTCGYDKVGLDAAGVCPECGQHS